ncbi:MAG: pilus assembly protein [Azospirillum sp.]|nr:pilus assembly protein [Azospirillum sp.]
MSDTSVLRSRRGNVAVMFALSAVPVLVLAGLAVDFGQAYTARARLASALDAAGLAVGSIQGSEAELQSRFQQFFLANYAAGKIGTPYDIVLTVNGNQINVSGKADVETSFLKLVGVDKLTVGSSGEVIRETKGLDLVMALDNTGSMAGNKMTQLKTAATDLVNILFGSGSTSETLLIGMVPFSDVVNIGTGQSAYVTSTAVYDWGPSAWAGCVAARSAPYDTDDSSIGSGGKWAPFYWKDDSNNNWYDSNRRRYTIDNAVPSSKGPNKYCPPALTPLTNNKTTLLNAISAMQPAGNTHINLGAVWAWRVISPDPPFTEGHEYDDPKHTKAVVLMTDGDNTMSNSVFTAYAYLSDGKLGTTNSSTAESRLDDRLTTVCDNMKAKGIVVYTIAVEVTNSSTINLLRSCATDTGKYFSASAADLTAVFHTIGGALSNLRLAK